jgi:hypothetical protein
MVDAQGKVRVVSKRPNRDLFWASCGGGGGVLGLVTEITLQLKPVPNYPPTMGTAVVSNVRFLVPDGNPATFSNVVNFMDYWQTWAGSVDPRLFMLVNMGRRPDIWANVTIPSSVIVNGVFFGPLEELQAIINRDLMSPTAQQLFTLGPMNYTTYNTYMDYFYDFAGMPLTNNPSYYDPLNGNALNLTAAASLINATRVNYKFASYLSEKTMPGDYFRTIRQWTMDTEGFCQLDNFGPNAAVTKRRSKETAFPYRSLLFSLQYGVEWPASITDISYDNLAIGQTNILTQALLPFYEDQVSCT